MKRSEVKTDLLVLVTPSRASEAPWEGKVGTGHMGDLICVAPLDNPHAWGWFHVDKLSPITEKSEVET